MTEIDCMKFPESGKFRGIAIITFKTEAAAKRALVLDGSDMGGLNLKIQPHKSERANKALPFTPAIAESYNRIYVGNLSHEITEHDLRHLFSECTITSIRFGFDLESVEYKGYGHVEFADSESVRLALKLDQKVVCGRPIRIIYDVTKIGTVNRSTPFQQKTISNQLKSEESKPLQQNKNTNQPNCNNTNEVASVIDSSKKRRRICYECRENGHLSSACPEKQPTDQINPVTIYYPLKREGIKLLEQKTNANQSNSSNGTHEVAPVPDCSKIRRRICYKCGKKGHLSTTCRKKQPTDQPNPVTIYYQLKSEDSKLLEQNTNTNQSYSSNGTHEVAPVPDSSKIRRRICYECGKQGHLSTTCRKKQPTDQPNPVTIYYQLKSEDSKLLEQNTNTNQSYSSNGTHEVAPVPDSSKIRRRICYECGKQGHLSTTCRKKQPTDQPNPATIYDQLKSEDSKLLERNTNTNQSNSSNGTHEVAPVPDSSKIRRRICYECGKQGHLSTTCQKKQPTDQPNPVTTYYQLKQTS